MKGVKQQPVPIIVKKYGYSQKFTSISAFAKSIEVHPNRVHSGLSRGTKVKGFEIEKVNPHLSLLSPIQKEVLEFAIKEKTIRQTGYEMKMTSDAVKGQRAEIMRKLGAITIVGAIVKAIQLKIIEI